MKYLQPNTFSTCLALAVSVILLCQPCTALAEPVADEQLVGVFQTLTNLYGELGLFDPGQEDAIVASVARFWASLDQAADVRFTGQRTALDRRVIKLAYTPLLFSESLPIDGIALIQVTADVLRTVEKSMAMRIAIHDFLHDWRSEPQDFAGLEDLVNAMANLGVADAAPILGEAARLQPQLQIFQTIAQQRNYFVRALKADYNLKPSLEDPFADATLAEGSPAARQILAMVQQARAWRRNFSNTGRFTDSQALEIGSGLDSEQAQRILAQLRDEADALQVAVNEMKVNRRERLRLLRESKKSDVSRSFLQDDIRKMDAESDLLQDELKAVIDDSIESQQRHAAFAQGLDSIVNEVGAKTGIPIATDLGQTLELSGADAPEVAAGIISALAIQRDGKAWALPLEGGEWVNLAVEGVWSPTCLLRRQQSIFGVTRDWSRLAEAEFGPDGFYVQAGSNSREGQRHDTSTETSDGSSTTHSKSDSEHVSLEGVVSLWGYLTVGGGAASSESWESSTTHSDIERKTETTYADSDHYIAAPFALPARVAGTPFPDKAAGSLLFVQVDPATDQYISVQTVRAPITSVAATKRAIGYLVVNDSRAGCYFDWRRKLKLHVSTMQTEGDVLKQMAALMGELSEQLRQERASKAVYAPADGLAAQRMRSDAMARLTKAWGARGIREVPEIVLAQFSAWLDNELGYHWSRQRARHLEHALKIKEIETSGLQHHLAKLRDDQSLAAQELRLALSSGIDDDIQWRLESLMASVRKYVFPYLDITRSDTLDVVRSDPHFIRLATRLSDYVFQGTSKEDLASESGDEDMERTVAESLSEASRVILTHISHADAFNPPTAQRRGTTVALRFPAGCVSRGTESDYVGIVNVGFNCHALWAAIHRGEVASLHLEPSHLYGHQGQGLGTSQAAPIIREIALMAALRTEDEATAYNNAEERLEWSATSWMTFATEDGPKRLRITNDRWLRPSASLFLFGDVVNAKRIFQERTAGLKSGTGLSPFARFQFDFSRTSDGFMTLLNSSDVAELVLLLHVETTPCLTRDCMKWALENGGL